MDTSEARAISDKVIANYRTDELLKNHEHIAVLLVQAGANAAIIAEREKILDEISEDFSEIVWNFYIPDEGNKQRAIELWQQVRKCILKRGESLKQGRETPMTDKEKMAELASVISFNLGLLEGEGGKMLYDNYPENFNLIIPKLAEKLHSLGYVRLPEE